MPSVSPSDRLSSHCTAAFARGPGVRAKAREREARTRVARAHAMAPRKRARADASSSAASATTDERISVDAQETLPEQKNQMIVQMWREGSLCDATVTVEGRDFECHRLVLSAASAYMRSALASAMVEGTTSHVQLGELEASTFEACLEFMYTSSVSVEAERLPLLLQAAARLQIVPLIEKAEAVMIERLQPSRAVSAWVLGDLLTRPKLVSAATLVVKESFGEVAAADDFVELPAPALLELLACDEIAAESEEDVYRAVLKWHAAQTPAPSHETEERLLRCVRWPLLASSFVAEHVNMSALVGRHWQLMAVAFQQASYGEKPKRRLGGRQLIECTFSSDFDENGLLYRLGMRLGTRPYQNPHEAGDVVVTLSTAPLSGSNSSMFVAHSFQPSGLIRDTACTQSMSNAWMAVDLGAGRTIVPMRYCLRSGRLQHDPRNWELQGSNDADGWVTLKRHVNDETLAGQHGTASWALEANGQGYRHFRIFQFGRNSSSSDHVVLAGIELYGTAAFIGDGRMRD